jgi:hypothetical protein
MGDYLLEESEAYHARIEENRFDYEQLHKDDMTEEERRHNLDADEDGSLWFDSSVDPNEKEKA